MIRILLSLVLLLSAPALAMAGTQTGPSPGDVAEVDILPGWRMENGRHMAALRVRLKDGWKTYWRAPGDAGIPPGFDWSGSKNLRAVALHWPAPEVFASNGMYSVGYKHELILPIELVPRDPERAIELRGKVAMGVCSDICMPMEASFRASLPREGSVAAKAIRRALALRPDTPAEAGLRRATCAVEPIADGLRVTARLDMPRLGAGEFVVLEPSDSRIWVSAAEVARSGRVLNATSDMVAPAGQPFLLSRADLTITVLAGGRAVEIEGCDSP